MVEGYGVGDIVDADMTVRHDEYGTRKMDIVDALDYANEPLDRDTVKQYKAAKADAGPATQETAEYTAMREEYEERARRIDFDLEVTYEDGSSRTLQGSPRTDLAFNGVYPSIILFEFDTDIPGNQDNHLVLREMRQYGDDFDTEIAKGLEFADNHAYNYHKAFSRRMRQETRPDLEAAAEDFAYTGEPFDFLAIHGHDGFHDRTADLDVPRIACPDWTVLDVDERDETIVGLRPYLHEVWSGGLNKRTAAKLGAFYGANRGWGRWLHDIDDEFFHGGQGEDAFLGFYDNEFPIAVGSDRAFDGSIWQTFYSTLTDQASDQDSHIDALSDIIREEERRVAETVADELPHYSEMLPRSVTRDAVPEALRAGERF